MQVLEFISNQAFIQLLQMNNVQIFYTKSAHCSFFRQLNLIFQIDGTFDGIIYLKPDLFNYKSIT